MKHNVLPKVLGEPLVFDKNKYDVERELEYWDEFNKVFDEYMEETNMPRLSRESQEPTSHIKHVSGLATTKVDPSEFMNQVRVLSDMVEKCEDTPFGVFMNDKIFKLLLSNNEVKFRLLSDDTKIGDSGFEHPLIGLTVFAMPDEEKYLGKREWFVVTKKEYDEYMAKVEEEKHKDHYHNG